MARFYGIVGYALPRELRPGVWVNDEIVERHYYGDVTSNNLKWQQAEQVNDNFRINNVVSIVADAFAYQNAQHIKYVEFLGTKWRVSNIQPQRPRLILNLGEVYNGPTGTTTSNS